MHASPQQGTVVPSQQSGGVTGPSLLLSWDEQHASASQSLALPFMLVMELLAAPAPVPSQLSAGSSQQVDLALISPWSFFCPCFSSSPVLLVMPLAMPFLAVLVDCDVGSAVGCEEGGWAGPQQPEPQAMFRGGLYR